MRLTHLDRIAMEVFLATITVPDEQLKKFIETKLVGLIQKVEDPAKEAMEKFAGNVIEPIFRAVPFVNLTYALGDIQKGSEAIDDAKAKGAQALESVIRDARELYEDIQGPSRLLSSLILGLAQYIEQIQDKIDAGEELTRDDVNAMNLYKEIGKDSDMPPYKDSTKRAAARIIASNLIKYIRNKKEKGIDVSNENIVGNMIDFLKGDGETTGAETKELKSMPEEGLLQLFLGNTDVHKSSTEKSGTSRKTRKVRQKTSLSNTQSRGKGSKKTRRHSRK